MPGLTQVFPGVAMRISLHIPRLLISSSFHSGFPETRAVTWPRWPAGYTTFTTLLILFLAGEFTIEGCISAGAFADVRAARRVARIKPTESRLEHWDLSDGDPVAEFRSPDRSNPQSREDNLNLRDFL